MNGIARYLLTGGIVLATMQIISGPVADWNARREGAEVCVGSLIAVIRSVSKFVCTLLFRR